MSCSVKMASQTLQNLVQEKEYYRKALENIRDFFPESEIDLKQYAFDLKTIAILALDKFPRKEF